MCAEAVSAMNPATANTTPISWITKILATTGFYQPQTHITKARAGAVSANHVLGYNSQWEIPDLFGEKTFGQDFSSAKSASMEYLWFTTTHKPGKMLVSISHI
jgi:hypothetical protein